MDIERPDRFKKKQFQRRIITGIVSIFVVAGLIYVFTLSSPLSYIRKDQTWTGIVQRGDMLSDVRGLGKLVPEDLRWITARASGRVESKMFLSGAEVSQNSVILSLSNPELEQQYVNAQLELKAAQAELTSTRVRLESELLALRSNFVQLRERAEMAELDEKINSELHLEGLVSELVLRRSELSAKHLKSRLVMEQERLEFQEQSIEPQLASQQTTVDRAIARLGLLETQMEALEVAAGSDGVIQRFDIEQGMQVEVGQQLALVANPNKLKAVVEIQESQAREILVGQKAVVDTRTSGTVEAVVSRIDPNVERGIVKVDVSFPNGLPSGVRADQTIQGTIELQRLTDVVFVDRPTLVKEGMLTSVFKVNQEGNRADRMTVQFGRSSVTLIEIVEGLNPGDQIILSDLSRFEEESALEIR